MQTDAKDTNEAPEELANAKKFPTALKDRALKILLDYSRDTGRKWQAIRSEIMAIAGEAESASAPLLTRQDLESWAARKSTLGDEKFKLVMIFLTHPATLERPEFDRAKLLTLSNSIERSGEVFDRFFTNYMAASSYFHASALSPVSQNAIAARKAAYAGLYTGARDNRSYCLSVSTMEECDAFIAHLFSWPEAVSPDNVDWNIDRFSGFSTIGNQIRLHLRGVVERKVVQNYIAPTYVRTSKSFETIELLEGSFVTEVMGNQTREGLANANQRMRYYDARAHLLRLERTSDQSLARLVEKFKLSVPL